ncbi:MAG: hypothetical protein JWP63_3106 [Candidatus Solibacter sp.]|nr:hypothetical protein [Candidatus Solibacter sp.]
MRTAIFLIAYSAAAFAQDADSVRRERSAYVDAQFGSGKQGSGANTDRGRVYLNLGQPNGITRVPSSRLFFPIEIWRYAEAPELGIRYELQILFYQRNGTGEYKLYSPNLNSIRDLLNPQPASRGMFPVNDIITEADVRTRLTVSPVENEVLDAAISVARGIKGVGNDEVLALVAAPPGARPRGLRADVTSRVVADRPPMTVFRTLSTEGVPQVDLLFAADVAGRIALEVQEGEATLARYETMLHFGTAKPVRYEQRLQLLPGEYRVFLTADSRTFPYTLAIPAQAPPEILTGFASESQRSRTPFEFGGMRLEPAPNGNIAVVQFAKAGRVTWRLRRGLETIWIARSEGQPTAVQAIGDLSIPPGTYLLEATSSDETRSCTVQVGGSRALPLTISYNANLTAAERYRSVGHQFLTRGNAAEARVWLERSWREQPADATKIELCRIAALTGKYDSARIELKAILDRDPDNFEAFTVLAYIELQLQDNAVAERLYSRALEIHSSPAVAKALAELRRRPL